MKLGPVVQEMSFKEKVNGWTERRRTDGQTKTHHNNSYSTANIKALRGSLGALSVNKLSHIPKLQPISAVYENQ